MTPTLPGLAAEPIGCEELDMDPRSSGSVGRGVSGLSFERLARLKSLPKPFVFFESGKVLPLEDIPGARADAQFASTAGMSTASGKPPTVGLISTNHEARLTHDPDYNYKPLKSIVDRY